MEQIFQFPQTVAFVPVVLVDLLAPVDLLVQMGPEVQEGLMVQVMVQVMARRHN